MSSADVPSIWVLAGPNGSGKSSVGGEVVLAGGGTFFNPDRVVVDEMAADPHLDIAQANSDVWHAMVARLRRAVEERSSITFETTLGGDTIYNLLRTAAESGLQVRIWYVALSSADLCVERVQARVARGGHDIPERRIRERYDDSRVHLVDLIPLLAELQVYDNSAPIPPGHAVAAPTKLLHMRQGRITFAVPPLETPDWAKAILLTAQQSDADAARAADH